MNCSCKSCKRYKGNCGYHYVDPETRHIDYEIPAEAARDKDGACLTYEAYISPEERALNAVKNSELWAECKAILSKVIAAYEAQHEKRLRK